jgi:hypothetical protein
MAATGTLKAVVNPGVSHCDAASPPPSPPEIIQVMLKALGEERASAAHLNCVDPE